MPPISSTYPDGSCWDAKPIPLTITSASRQQTALLPAYVLANKRAMVSKADEQKQVQDASRSKQHNHTAESVQNKENIAGYSPKPSRIPIPLYTSPKLSHIANDIDSPAADKKVHGSVVSTSLMPSAAVINNDANAIKGSPTNDSRKGRHSQNKKAAAVWWKEGVNVPDIAGPKTNSFGSQFIQYTESQDKKSYGYDHTTTIEVTKHNMQKQKDFTHQEVTALFAYDNTDKEHQPFCEKDAIELVVQDLVRNVGRNELERTLYDQGENIAELCNGSYGEGGSWQRIASIFEKQGFVMIEVALAGGFIEFLLRKTTVCSRGYIPLARATDDEETHTDHTLPSWTILKEHPSVERLKNDAAQLSNKEPKPPINAHLSTRRITWGSICINGVTVEGGILEKETHSTVQEATEYLQFKRAKWCIKLLNTFTGKVSLDLKYMKQAKAIGKRMQLLREEASKSRSGQVISRVRGGNPCPDSPIKLCRRYKAHRRCSGAGSPLRTCVAVDSHNYRTTESKSKQSSGLQIHSELEEDNVDKNQRNLQNSDNNMISEAGHTTPNIPEGTGIIEMTRNIQINIEPQLTPIGSSSVAIRACMRKKSESEVAPQMVRRSRGRTSIVSRALFTVFQKRPTATSHVATRRMRGQKLPLQPPLEDTTPGPSTKPNTCYHQSALKPVTILSTHNELHPKLMVDHSTPEKNQIHNIAAMRGPPKTSKYGTSSPKTPRYHNRKPRRTTPDPPNSLNLFCNDQRPLQEKATCQSGDSTSPLLGDHPTICASSARYHPATPEPQRQLTPKRSLQTEFERQIWWH